MPAGSPSPAASVHDAADIATRTVAIGRQHIHVAERAGRNPPFLLCNGLGATLELLAPLMQALGDIATIAFDVPGTGDSPPRR